MGSNAIAGYGGSVSGFTEVRRWSLDKSVKVLDCTSMGSAGLREVKAGIFQWEGTFDCLAVPSQTTGTTVVGTLSTGSATGTAAVTYTGSMLINQITPDCPYDDIVIWKVSFTGNGALS